MFLKLVIQPVCTRWPHILWKSHAIWKCSLFLNYCYNSLQSVLPILIHFPSGTFTELHSTRNWNCPHFLAIPLYYTLFWLLQKYVRTRTYRNTLLHTFPSIKRLSSVPPATQNLADKPTNPLPVQLARIIFHYLLIGSW